MRSSIKKQAQSLFRPIVALAVCALLTACWGEKERIKSQEQIIAELRIKEAKTTADTERAKQDLDKANQDATEAVQSKSKWQAVAWVVSISCVGVLVFGVVLGSSTRKEANAQKKPKK